MADPTATVEPPAPEGAPSVAEPQKPEGKPDQAVPYERFKQVNDQLNASKTQLEQLQQWKDEQEKAKLSEIERANRERDEAAQRASEAEQKATVLERGGWVAEAARKAGFADPGDAAVFLNLADIDDEAKAAKAVEDLTKAKPHLLGQPSKPAGFGTIAGAPSNTPDVPVGPDGKPDHKKGLGQELFRGLLGGK